MTRGVVLPLTDEQRVARMRYLAQLASIDTLDSYARKDGAPSFCPDIYYLLKDHNGGKDPTAPDPADRWSNAGSQFVNRTCDCIGGQAWCGGWDRDQPNIPDPSGYGGEINTDSMLIDARGKALRFRILAAPKPGCMVVWATGDGGMKMGHIGGVIGVPDHWDPKNPACWAEVVVIDVAMRTPQRANQITTALMWMRAGGVFVESLMAPTV